MKVALWVLGIIVFVGICVGAWFLYWAVAQANTDAQYNVNTHSQQYQQALIQQERDRAQGWQNATDDGQKKQIAETFCAAYLDLTTIPNDLLADNARMCS